jgi:hypothetical protein
MILFSGIAGRAWAARKAPPASLNQLAVLYDADLPDLSESTAIQKSLLYTLIPISFAAVPPRIAAFCASERLFVAMM